MAASFNIHTAGPLHAGLPQKGELLATVPAKNAREALDAYAEAEGFVAYASVPELEESVRDWLDGSASAPFKNFEIVASDADAPESFVNFGAVKAMSDAELLQALEEAGPVDLYVVLRREQNARGLRCSCEWEETGDAESGPSMSMTRMDEACRIHGREAKPEEWARYEADERSFSLSLIGSALLSAWKQRDERREAMGMPPADGEPKELLEGNEALALEEFEKAERQYSDAHAAERAATDVAEMLLTSAEPPEPVASRKAPPECRCNARGNEPHEMGSPGCAYFEPRACRFCGGEVESAKPETDFCRNCFYSGRWAEEQHAELLAAFESIAGVRSAAAWHTGGGCFNLAVTFEDGRVATPSVSFREGDGSWGIEPGFPSDPDDRWGLVVAETDMAWAEWDEERLAMPQEALGLTEVELVGYIAKLAAQPGALEPQRLSKPASQRSPQQQTADAEAMLERVAAEDRTVLVRVIVSLAGSDSRSAEEIGQLVQGALEVGSEGAELDEAGFAVALAEEI